MNVYYNEIEAFPCAVIEANIARGRIPAGRVHCADIKSVSPDDLAGFGQRHLFAGIGVAAYACRLAGIPDEFDILTFGFPCQDISAAGKGAGLDGARSGLFFEACRLINAVRPTWLLAENVSALRTRGIEHIIKELENIGYCVLPPIVVGADDVGAPQKRKRVWIVARRADDSFLQLADADGDGQRRVSRQTGRWEKGTELGTDVDRESDGLVNPNSAREQQPSRDDSQGRGRTCDRSEELDDTPCMGHLESHNGVPAGRKATFGSSEAMAHSNGERLEVRQHLGANSLQEQSTIERGCFAWPAGPSCFQFDWEEPRVVEPSMGGATHGVASGLVRCSDDSNGNRNGSPKGTSSAARIYSRWRREALKGLGNAWVPQTAAPIIRWIYETEMGMNL